MIFALVFFAALAILGPRFGADSRDSRDWAPSRAFARRRHVASEVPAETSVRTGGETAVETGGGDPGDGDAAEPEEYAHERERAGHSPAYC
ncbi:hypothetical protein EDD29_5838 [Actinocorallia herbida]|uniref:Secreted protein n=1 Tax=Actinocorallia herbida TaxID=58109 RepID=A0A3N1D3W2_9ACTN|nr:hypothetical protein [Actinocorallia herbida]ROO88176.1 hypothetical protein EDD29_5838 [Actinocorallia herbida]